MSARLFVMLVLLSGCARENAASAAGGDTSVVAPTRVDTGALAGSGTVQLFLVVLNDSGHTGEKIGCGDRVTGVPTSAGDTQAPLRFALERLLTLKSAKPHGTELYNALDGSDLRVGSIAVADGHATIHLTGTFSYGGVCDAPRIEAQLTRTATQFPAVRTASFFINGRPLRDMLSEK